MKSKELIQRARDGEVVGDGSAQINALLAAYDSALNGQDYDHQWYAVRWKRLRELIESDAAHIFDGSCNIMANGTADPHEPPNYDMMLNGLRHEIEKMRLQCVEAKEAARWYFAKSGTLMGETALKRWPWLGTIQKSGPIPKESVK